MIVELVAGAAFLGCLGVLVVQMTGWRPRRRSWGAAPIVGDVIVPPRPGATSVHAGVERDLAMTGNAYLVREAPTQRVEVVIRIEVQGPDA